MKFLIVMQNPENNQVKIPEEYKIKKQDFATLKNKILTREGAYLFQSTMHSTAVISSNAFPFEFQIKMK